MSGSSQCRLLVTWWLQVGASACELGGARQAYVFDLPLLPHISPYLMQVEEKKHNYRLYKVCCCLALHIYGDDFSGSQGMLAIVGFCILQNISSLVYLQLRCFHVIMNCGQTVYLNTLCY